MTIDKIKDITSILYPSGKILNPFTEKYSKIIFADDTASGRPCRLVDNYIAENVYPYYSNTHSNATCGIVMKNLIKKTRDIIRHAMNLSDHHKIFFTGNGCTGAINHLVNKIDYTVHDKINIHISPFEHHSNFLPWREKSKIHSNIDINYVGTNDNFDLDIDKLINDLEHRFCKSKNVLNIVSLIACSNVTGRRYSHDYLPLIRYIKDKQKKGHGIYLLLDYACSAPYDEIDMDNYDGIFFSGHKFLGGQCTPGVLIVNEKLLETECPYAPGGGCVEKANDQCVVYKDDLEEREMGGTPNIVGIIRLGYLLMIKESIMKDIIKHNESILIRYVTDKMREFERRYDKFHVVDLASKSDKDLPIYPVVIEGLHYNLITVLFNDLFGIQTRGGVSCCGTLGRICNEKLHYNGWCRVSFNYLLTQEEIETILDSLEYIIVNGESYKKQYRYDKDKNLWTLR